MGVVFHVHTNTHRQACTYPPTHPRVDPESKLASMRFFLPLSLFHLNFNVTVLKALNIHDS